MLLPWVDRLTHLTDLDLSLTHDEAAGETFHEIIMNCPHLATVNFAKCRGWTDGAILHLSKRTPHLSSMNLRGCENFTDMGFTFLSMHGISGKQRCGCRDMAQRARSRCQFLAARLHGVLHWHHHISTVCVDLSSSPEFREIVYESCSAIQCVLIFCSVNNCLPSNTTNQTKRFTRV